MNLIHPSLIPLAVPIDSVNLLEGNPRKGAVDAIAQSYFQFGQRKPIVVRRDGMATEAGNHGLLAARQLGWTEIAVVIVDDDDATAAAFAIADNRTSDLGTYDDDLLAALIATVTGSGDAELLDAIGYTDRELAALIASTAPRVELTDPDDIPEIPTEPISKLGDIWTCGRHRVICGDATNGDAYKALLGAEQVNMIMTDPPYGVDYTGGTNNPTARDKLLNDTADVFGPSLPLAYQHSTDDAALYLWFAGGKGHLAYDAIRTAHYEVRALIIWHKLRAHYGAWMSQYMPKHEPMLYAHKTGHAPKWRGPTNEVTVWEYDQPTRSELHPTQKPVAPLERAINNSTDHGDLILDMFGGSGSTLIAAHQTGRTARIIELDPRYVDVIIRRYEDHTGEKAERA